MTWDELLQTRTAYILFVRGDHFVCADTSEQSESSAREPGPLIRIWEINRVAAWWSRDDLEAVWAGEALALTRPELSASETQGPRVAWATCWKDCGFVHAAQKSVDFTFPYRNVGTEGLTLEVVGSSCSCTVARLSATELAPAKQGELRGSIDIRGKRGLFHEYLAVRTNDLHSALTVFQVCGGVYPNTVSSVDTLRFGQVLQGGEAVARFFLHDPDTGNLKILRSECRLVSDRASCGTCSVSVNRIAADSPLIGKPGKYPLRVGDYVVDATLSLQTGCPVGPLSGEIVLVSNLPEGMTEIHVGVEAAVRSDIEATPSALLITRKPGDVSGSVVPVRIQLARPQGRTLEIERTWTSGRIPCRATFSGFVGEHGVELLISHTELPAVDPPITGHVHCRFTDGASIELPVVVLLR